MVPWFLPVEACMHAVVCMGVHLIYRTPKKGLGHIALGRDTRPIVCEVNSPQVSYLHHSQL
jgi:hypothetical protein